MTKLTTKLVLLTFLIPLTLATQKAHYQDQNHLSNENLSDDSRPRTYLGEKITPKHLIHIKGRILGDLQKSQTGEQKKSKSGKNTSFQENIPYMEEEKGSEDQNHMNHDHRPSELSERTKHHGRIRKLDEDTRQSVLVEQITPKNKSKIKNIDSLTSQEEQKTVNHKHLNEVKRLGHVYDHTMVTDNAFMYMVAVLKGAKYLCAGALIDDSWVLTAANGINSMKDTTRFLRIRLGSINYKKGGMLIPVKYIELHPYFNSSKPTYDLALIMLAKPVRQTAKLNSIRLQLTHKEVTSTHFIMTSWRGAMKPASKSQSIGAIKHHRILSVTHLHPSDPEECFEELKEIDAGQDGIMCLESSVEDNCLRDTGAPIVFNGVLWGIISSWKPEDCEEEDSSIFATLVSAKNVSTWIHAVVHGHKWTPKYKYRR